MLAGPPPRDLVLEQLDRMLSGDTFAGAERSRVLLRFLVEHVLDEQPERLKEYTIGAEALGRGEAFDPRIDPIVRAEASRLRQRLQRYYAIEGVSDTLLVTLPKGSYVPQIEMRAVADAVPAPAPAAGDADGSRAASGWLQRLIWFVIGGLTVGAAAMLLVSVRGREASPSGHDAPRADRPGTDVAEFNVELASADRSPGSDWGNDLIISPDGTRIVFVARGSNQVLRLMTMIVGQPRTIAEMEETEGARAPFFSPDGRWVGFWSDARLKAVPVDGGSPVELAGVRDFGGASWGKGEIIATLDGALWRVPETPGRAEVIAAGLKNDRQQPVVPWWPHVLPDGRHVLFTAVGPDGADAATVEVLSLADGTRRPLIRGGTFARYLPGGYLLYVNQGTLFAVQFDPERLTVRGARVPVLDERVAYSPIFGFAQYGLARDGRLIYRRSPPLVPAWLARGGGVEPVLTRAGAYSFPRLSPDGHRLAINVTEGGVLRTEVHDLRRPDQPVRLPFPPGSMSPVWHPAGFLVAGSTSGMSWMKSDGGPAPGALTPTDAVQIPWSFNADGTRLAYHEASSRATFMDLWTMPVGLAGGRLAVGEPEPFLQTPHREAYPSFSPDGRWLVYTWGPNGRFEVYVRPFPHDGSTEIKVSRDGGRIARWLANGREIVYRTDDHRLMVAAYQVRNGTFVAGAPAEWTPERLGDTGVLANFDVHGDRVLGLVPSSREDAERARTQVTVMPRFAEAVRRRLASGGS